MKSYKLVGYIIAGLSFLLMPLACSTPPKGPDTEQVREDADKGMRDLRMEEEQRKR